MMPLALKTRSIGARDIGTVSKLLAKLAKSGGELQLLFFSYDQQHLRKTIGYLPRGLFKSQAVTL